MAETVIIVGAGKVGLHLAALLVRQGHAVTVVDPRDEAAAEVSRTAPGARTVCGSGTDPATLEAAHVREASVVAAVAGIDEVNLVVASLARLEFGVRRTVGRVNDPANAWLFTQEMGVDLALNQADLLAYLIAEQLSLVEMTTLLKLTRGDFTLVEERVDARSAAEGRALRDLRFPPDCTVTAVLRHGSLLVPRGDTVLAAGDEVLALVRTNRLTALTALFGPPDAVGIGSQDSA
ncbi:MAG: TrkA family potassium uptake protein [Deltaproteobacteria bacterium]|nr:TrkA family potassium uptake protein [Deltaproteobacteria bacterium]